MKNLLKYEDWLSTKWVSFNGTACQIIERNRKEGWLRLKTSNGEVVVREDDSDLGPVDDISLPLFLQIGAPIVTH